MNSNKLKEISIRINFPKKAGVLLLFWWISGFLISAEASKPLEIVTSWSILEDVANNVGKENIRVTSLAPRGIDLHDIKLTPGDQIRLRKSHLVIWLGLNLENWLLPSLKNVPKEKQLEIGKHLSGLLPLYSSSDDKQKRQQANDHLHEAHEHPGAFDPHIWHDVKMIIQVSEIIAHHLSIHDPKHAPGYKQNAQHYILQLKKLNGQIHEQLSFIPKEHRLLVTGHDAFRYFGEAYDFQTLAPRGLSTHDQPSPWVMRHIISTLREKKIRVLFIESGNTSSLLGRIGQEADIEIKAELMSSNLNAFGETGDSYIGFMQKNIDTITEVFQSALTQ
ncbi:MAG: zinc ABC transporter substrate-binding protein [SAR324 cluster bacterium]|nr:zinc ABC transporter substrate-binding protein [SAR324 cluster bacterium]